MITILGLPIELPFALRFLAGAWGSFAATALAWAGIALVVYLLLKVVLRRLARRLPGEVDNIVLAIISTPLLILIIVFGAVRSLSLLPLHPSVTLWTQKIVQTLVIMIIAYLLWRVIKDVLVYYGEFWVRRTESRVDDVVVPIVNLFGPLLVIILAAILILPLWGINVTSVLAGAGILGLVLGLALQDTLSNIFSGMSLLSDAPFGVGDLIVMSDGKTCRVQHVGMRATKFQDLDANAQVYVPNKLLANSTIVNITKPTVDLKVGLNVGVSYGSDLDLVSKTLLEIAHSHPNILGDLHTKIEAVEAHVANLRRRSSEAGDSLVPSRYTDQAERFASALERLRREHALNGYLIDLHGRLQELAKALHGREWGGLSAVELQDIHCQFISPIDAQVKLLMEAMYAWSQCEDPWVDSEWQAAEQIRWADRNQLLSTKWNSLRAEIAQPDAGHEMRLDDMAHALHHWLDEQYKSLPQTWRAPEIIFKGFTDAGVQLQLNVFIDDIRPEHFERRQRVITELAREIYDRFLREQIGLHCCTIGV